MGKIGMNQLHLPICCNLSHIQCWVYSVTEQKLTYSAVLHSSFGKLNQLPFSLVGTNVMSNVFVSLPCWLINNPELGLIRARLGGLVYISRYILHSFREWLWFLVIKAISSEFVQISCCYLFTLTTFLVFCIWLLIIRIVEFIN